MIVFMNCIYIYFFFIISEVYFLYSIVRCAVDVVRDSPAFELDTLTLVVERFTILNYIYEKLA